MTEWYANGPVGLEQGFDIASRPGAGAGALTLALALSGGLAPRMRHGSVLLDGHGAALRYGGLVVTDAGGRTLRSSLTLARGNILIRVDDHGARYPLRIDPFLEQARLTQLGPPDGSFGYSTTVSGSTIVVGDPAYESSRGAAYVFEEPVSGWANATETKKLIAEDGKENNFFGESVALSGETIVVGAPYNKTTVTYAGGAAYVFEAASSKWASAKQVAQLTVPDLRLHEGKSEEVPELQGLGTSVAISGSTIVAGAPGRLGDQGAAYVFVKPGGGWGNTSTFNAQLHANEFTTGCPEFGKSIAMSSGTVVVGAPGTYFAATNCEHHLKGEVSVFVEPEAGWSGELAPTDTLTPSASAADDQFGASVALAEPDGTIVAGSPGQKVGASAGQGAAYVFVKPGGGWTGSPVQTQLSAPTGAAEDEFGKSVDISSDGSTVVVAAPSFHGGGHTSAAWAFAMPAGGWGATIGAPEQLTSSGVLGLGYSVAVSGTTVLVGAPGAAYVFGTGLGISITSPANGATYAPGQEVKATYSCTPPTGDTITRCAGPVSNGAAIDTSTLGIHNFTVEAEDKSGGTALSVSAYRVESATPKEEATSTTATTPTTVHRTPAEVAAEEAATQAALQKESEEFVRWIREVMDNPENATIGSKLLNEGGIPVSYKLVPEPGFIATTGSTVTWNKPPASKARASSQRKKPIVVFKLSYRITKAGKASFKIPLTSAGRKLLKQDLKAHRSVVLYWTVTFTPQANRPVTKTFKVTLKPRRAKPHH